MEKREYDDKEKPLVISTDSRQTKRSEQPADSLVEVQETGLNIWEGCSRPLGQQVPTGRGLSSQQSKLIYFRLSPCAVLIYIIIFAPIISK